MAGGFGSMIAKLKMSPKTIVFPEGKDERILEAASRLLSSNFLHPILVGKEEEIFAASEVAGFNVHGAKIIDPDHFDRFDEMVELFMELRAGKGITLEQARETCRQANYFSTMLVKMGIADALLGGATYSTADTVRPALQLIKTKPGNKLVSSCFIMVRPSASGENEILVMGDCANNIHPTSDDLVEIAHEASECARVKEKMSIRCELPVKKQEQPSRICRWLPERCSLMLRWRQGSLRTNARMIRWQDTQIPLFSLISMQETSDIRLHSDWGISTLTGRFSWG